MPPTPLHGPDTDLTPPAGTTGSAERPTPGPRDGFASHQDPSATNSRSPHTERRAPAPNPALDGNGYDEPRTDP